MVTPSDMPRRLPSWNVLKIATCHGNLWIYYRLKGGEEKGQAAWYAVDAGLYGRRPRGQGRCA